MEEVAEIMVTLFDQEKVMEIHDYHVAEAAREAGVQEGTLKSIQNLIKNLELSTDRAMEALGLSDTEHIKYVEMLEQR